MCAVRPERLYACKPIIIYPYRALIVLLYHIAVKALGLGEAAAELDRHASDLRYYICPTLYYVVQM